MSKAGYPVEVKANEAKAAGTYMPVSTRNSRAVCRKINGMPVERAKAFLNELIDENIDINNKHHTNAAQYILDVLESAEKNAEFKGLEKLRIRTIAAEEGPHRMRRKRKGGRMMKLTHVKVVLEGKAGEKKEKIKTPAKTNETGADTKTEENEKKEHAHEHSHAGHEHKTETKATEKISSKKGEAK